MMSLKNTFKITAFICAAALTSGGVICREYACASDSKFVYNSHGRRDPFIPLINPPPPRQAAPVAGIVVPGDIKFTGVAIVKGGQNKAIINGELYKEGDMIDQNTRLKTVSQGHIIVTVGTEDRKYELFEDYEGGVK